jgi:hypothetical protein
MVELSGVLRTCIWSPWCYCSNTLLSVRDSAKYGFLLLVLICHNCGDTPHFHWVREVFFILPHLRIFPSSVGILLLPNQCFGMHGIQNNWITEIQFYFWFCQDLFILQYNTALKTSVLNYLEFFCKILVKSAASTLIQNISPFVISNFYL